MKLSAAIDKARSTDREVSVVFYCAADNRYAVVETDGVRLPYILHSGRVEQRVTDGAWRFSGSGAQVCEGFGNRGYTLAGGTDLSREADHVYRTAAGFDRAISAFEMAFA